MAKKNDESTPRRMPREARVTLGDLFSEKLQPDAGSAKTETKGNGVQHIDLGTVTDGDFLEGVYFCTQKNSAMSKAGKPFLNLTIADKTGEMTVRVFDNAERIGQVFMEGDFIYLQGRVQLFQSNLQTIAKHIERVPPEQLNPEDFMPASHMDPGRMEGALRAIVGSMQDEHLRSLCVTLLDDPEAGPRFFKAPAAKSMHHAYVHGLLEHTLSMARLVELICTHYKNLDRDMLLAGVVFHDLGKIYELSYDIGIDYTEPGKLLGHINIGMLLVDRYAEGIEGFPVEKKRLLEHLLLAHHGSREFGSPVLPATVEASILHHLDNLDAKINAFLLTAQKAPEDAQWTDRHYLLGTQVRKTVKSDGPLYDFFLPDPDEKE